MKESVKNALRSAVVVIGALAFGHLTLQLAFKPYLEKTQQQMEALQNQEPQSSESSESNDEQFDDTHILMSDEGFTNLDDS
ncbi:hypothetical protein DCAR_0102501 [Daucus carota subsp. sativus]|uniref:Uncharacterized protein n=1 Tax=Daucus carota subsp. sativus TaxID=79200 RepID=A0A166H5F9_DAUCS|nr:hypothetical protein DCAR_0102501 [Daucus carota subsp. sativus]